MFLAIGLVIGVSLKTVPKLSVYRPDSLFQEQLGVYRSYPVSHSNLKIDQTDYRELCWKTISRRVDHVESH